MWGVLGFALASSGCAGAPESHGSDEELDPSGGQPLLESPQASAFLTDVQRAYRIVAPAALEKLAQNVGAVSTLPQSTQAVVAKPLFETTNRLSITTHGNALVPKLSDSARIAVRMPTRSVGQFSLSDAKSGVQVKVRLAGALDAPGENAGSAIVYRNGHEHGDVVLRPSDTGVEDYVVVRNDRASTLAYDVELGSEVKGLRLVSDTLELLDESGDPRLRVAPPYLVDASGNRREARLEVSGCNVDTNPAAPWGRAVTPAGASSCRVSVSWDGTGLQYPVLVDPSWVGTGAMITGRANAYLCGPSANFPGLLMASGGSTDVAIIKTAEVYNPVFGTWASTAPLTTARTRYAAATYSHTAFIFDDKCLVAGGISTASLARTKTAEVYSFGTGTWTAAPNMTTARADAAAASTDTGKVLVFGGNNGTVELKTGQVYNFATNTWAAIPNATKLRTAHTLTRLNPPGGLSDVIAVGGAQAGAVEGSCERYSPTSNTWTSCGTLPTPVAAHTATLCTGCAAPRNGKVIVAGGLPNASTVTRAIQSYDPILNSWTAEGNLLPSPGRIYHQAFLRTVFGSPSTVLIIGGASNTSNATIKTVFAWPTGGTTLTGNLVNERSLFGVGLLPNGNILIAGGWRSQSNSVISAAEQLVP